MLSFVFLSSGEITVQVAVEMPFPIRSIESPTHKIKMKVRSCIIILYMNLGGH